MDIYDLLVGRKVKIMTDAKVEVELEIKSIKTVPHTREITPDTRENDWWGESVDWTTYAVTFVNGYVKEYNSLEDIKF